MARKRKIPKKGRKVKIGCYKVSTPNGPRCMCKSTKGVGGPRFAKMSRCKRKAKKRK